MLTLTRFGMTMVATAAMVILLFRCNIPPAADSAHEDARPAGRHGELLFLLNDSDQVRIPGHWNEDTLTLHNAQESLVLLPLGPDTWSIPVFDGTLSLAGDTGSWKDVLRPGDYHVPVRWEEGDDPHQEATWSTDTLSWLLAFGQDDPWFGQLFIQRDGEACRGSISTSTGDFRFLHGHLRENGTFVLQTFDGAHLFRFSGSVNAEGDIEEGLFLSGNHYSSPFTGQSIAASESGLTDAPIARWTGQPVAYTALDLSGDTVTWKASDASNVHILSVMGSWCPNCMDEHRLLLDLIERHPEVHVHTLAFERGVGLDRPDSEANSAAIERMKRYAVHMGMDHHADRWHIRVAGPASKSKAQQVLPFLDKVVSFPTTVIVGVDGESTPWIHSGFNGPATGPAHDLELARFEAALSGSMGSR
ncbi:MAG: TlpA family protein disulfide reductase [Flavobacteriales bacterium]